MNPRIIAARWSLQEIPSEQLPRIALQWLEDGLDSPTLRILAGETNPIMSEVGPMFDVVLEELNIAVPACSSAFAHIAREVAQNIVDGAIAPYDGAIVIDDLWVTYAQESEDGYSREFLFLAVDHEEFHSEHNRVQFGEEYCQRARAELEAQIIAEARKLLV